MSRRTLFQSVLAAAALIIGMIPGIATAQAQILPEPNFSIEGIADVLAMATQADGKLIIGGSFASINGVERKYLARLNSNGSLDTSLDVGLTDSVSALAISGTTLYAGGFFGVKKIDLITGLVDAAWGTPFNTVYALAVGSDGVYAGGRFSTVGGQAHGLVVKLSLATGAADSTWSPMVEGADQIVQALALGSDGLYIAGGFATVNGVPRWSIAKLNLSTGTPDANWNPGSDQSAYLLALAMSGDNLFVGGYFSSLGGQPVRSLGKISTATGVVDATWKPTLDDAVYAMALNGTDLYAVGTFTQFGGAATGVGKININTGVVAPYAVAMGPGAVHADYGAAVAVASGSLWVGGTFRTVNGNDALSLARLDLDSGASDTTRYYAAAVQGYVDAMVRLSDGSIVVGGNFLRVNGKTHSNLFRMLSDGTVAQSWVVNTDSPVLSLAADATNLYVGGRFQNIGGTPTNYLAKLSYEGVVDTAFNPDPNSDVAALSLVGADLFLGGNFSEVGGVARNSLAKVAAASGALNASFDPDVTGIVSALAANGSDLYVGGIFTSIGGGIRDNLARVSQSTGLLTGVAMNATGGGYPWVSALFVSDGKLYAGGTFGKINGNNRSGAARFDAGTGVFEPGWIPPLTVGYPEQIESIGATPSGIILGGNIYTTGHNQLIKVSPATGALDTAWNPGVSNNGEVHALVTAGETVFAGGHTFFGSIATPFITLFAYGPLTPSTVLVYEFFAPSLNHYFRTAIAEEAASLIANPQLGFNPTGNNFLAYLRSAYPLDAKPVCRFYGSVTPGPNSHFYTADPNECAALKGFQYSQPNTSPRWNFEENAFGINLPASGVCPANAPVKVYRNYNNRAAQGDSNHRFTTDINIYNTMIGLGWAAEGVVMCALP